MPEIVPSSTWIDKLSPNAARLALVMLAVIAVALIWVSLGITEPVRRAGQSDLDAYERVVAALKAGQGYYTSLHQVLLDGGYGTLSPLNWRPPAFLIFLSWFPSLIDAQVFLALVTLVAWMIAVAFVYRSSGIGAAVAAAIVMAASLISIIAYRAELSFELCAGTLVLISVAAYGLGWRWFGLVAGVLALFVRELAVLYVLVCLVLAIRERRWGETIAWVCVIATYAAFYLWHIAQLTALLGPADHVARVDWLQLGGPVFVLRTAAFNGILLAAPYWVAALVLVLGFVGLKQLPRAGITVSLYLLLFLFYGRPENEYWGALYAPLVALGLVFSPGALRQLFARARGAVG
jgi:hypothetical protein